MPGPSSSSRRSWDQETEAFQVRGWEIRWETTGKTFKLAVTGDQDFGVVVDHPGEGRGSTYPVGSGTYRLHVTADGPWTVRINHSFPLALEDS